MKYKVSFVFAFLIIGILAACGRENYELESRDGLLVDPNKEQSIFGSGGLNLGGPSKTRQTSRGGGIGVNAFLWRASLDTLSIWPIASADPFGGVIITDWYTPPETPNEQFKFNVFILDRSLRADGIRVSVFRQTRDASGDWRQAVVQPATQVQLENAILTRARQFKTESLEQ
ncbi:MAG: hypothetical protein CBD27_04295 [Rhodospirillaceae bacterium TMED167]|nr:hypothetical protein [Rhodospirillaceae bacterium]OUW28612.1 MAG: hypothetical protein CBD27_04295 [Rhodospirillaceae bacterium TMED167]